MKIHEIVIATVKNVYFTTECVLICRQTNDCVFSILDKNTCYLYSHSNGTEEGDVKEMENETTVDKSCKRVRFYNDSKSGTISF